MEEIFRKKLQQDRLLQKCNSFSLSLQQYYETIQKVKRIKQKLVKEPNDYKVIKRFDVLEIDGVEKLIVPLKESSDIIYYVHDEELFEILSSVHASTGHGGRDRMVKEIKKMYRNITYKDIATFLSVCDACLQKQKREKRGVPIKTSSFKDLSYRGQVDLIDFQSRPDGDYKFIMVYQDHLTKFVILRPLRLGKEEEVADELVNIFTLIGAPTVLESDKGRDYLNRVIDNLKQLFPGLKLVVGKPRDYQSQGSGEVLHQVMENTIKMWMQENKSSNWSKGLRFIQLKRNKTHHSGIKRSPHEALFGTPLRLGLATSSIPKDIIKSVQEEGELENIINAITPTQEEQNNEQYNVQTLFSCAICLRDCTNEKTECGSCGSYFHPACGIFDDYENYVVCGLCERKEKVTEHVSFSLEGLEPQPKRTRKMSEEDSQPSATIVGLPIPEGIEGRADAMRILATDHDSNEDGFYKLEMETDGLKQFCASSSSSSEMPDVEVPLETVAKCISNK